MTIAITDLTQTEMEAVILRVRKLLRLADANRNSSEEERDSAMVKAMEIMQEYNLSHTSMQIGVDDEQISAVTEQTTEFNTEKWVIGLAQAVSELYYVGIYRTTVVKPKGDFDWNKSYLPRIVFVGTPVNIAAATNMLEWLIKSVRAESNQRYKDAYMRKSFRLGAARCLQQRANQIIRDERLAKQPAPITPAAEGRHIEKVDNGSAPVAQNQLMVLRNKLKGDNERYMEKLKLRPGRSSRGASISGNAYEAGKGYANGLNLNKQLGGGNHKRIGG